MRISEAGFLNFTRLAHFNHFTGNASPPPRTGPPSQQLSTFLYDFKDPTPIFTIRSWVFGLQHRH